MTDTREHLARLPAELIILVAEQLRLSTRDLAAFARASPRYSGSVISVLYKMNIREENASACKTFWVNQHNTRYPLTWCATTDTETFTVLWAVLKENTQTMALLVRYGADINSMETSIQLDYTPQYRWINRLRRWNSYAEDDDQRETRVPLPNLPGQFGLMPTLPPAAAALIGLPSAGAPHNPAPFVPQFPQLPALQPGVFAPPPVLGIPPGRPWGQGSTSTRIRFAPLALAARKGLITAAKWLLENGADPDVPARDLCRCDNEPVTSSDMWRVPQHASRPLVDQPHWTALHLAIHHGHDDIVELLVDHGANARQVCRPEDGPCSALHTAFIHERMSIVESLMYRFKGTDMVDINARGRAGITPMHIAYCVQSAEGPLVALALKFGAYVNLEYEIDRNQWTLFSMACVRQDWKFARRLLKLGANADFDLELQSGGRCTLDDLRRHIEWSNDREVDWDQAALSLALDKLLRDHEVAQL